MEILGLDGSFSSGIDSRVFLGVLVDLVFEVGFLEVTCFEVFAFAGFSVTALPFLAVDDGTATELLVDLGAEAAAIEERLGLVEEAVASTDFFCRFSGVAGGGSVFAAALRLAGAILCALDGLCSRGEG